MATWTGSRRSAARPLNKPLANCGSTWNAGRRRGVGETSLELVEDLGGLAGADAVAAEADGFDCAVERADTSRRLELDVGRGGAAHQLQVVDRGASRTISGRCLHVICSGLAADHAQSFDVLRLEEAVLENHLHERSALVSGMADRGDLGGDRLPLSAQNLADVDHHVELGGPVVHGAIGLEQLGGRDVASMRKADGCADGHSGSLEDIDGERNGVRFNANAGDRVLRSQVAAGPELGGCEAGSQQGMIDSLGDEVVCEFHGERSGGPAVLVRPSDSADAGLCERIVSQATHGRQGVSRMSRPTVAVIGASRDRSKYGNKSLRAHQRAGYDVYPVNPHETEIEGLRVYSSIGVVPVEHLDRVTVYVQPDVGLELMDEIARKGRRSVAQPKALMNWMSLPSGRTLGLNVIRACSIVAVGENPGAF